MANSNPFLILRRCRDSVIRNLRDLFRPENNTAVVPPFRYNYRESSSSGTIRFVGNPANLNTIIINGITITFVTGAPIGNQVQIGVTTIITQANFIAFVNAHSSILNITATQSPVNNVVNLTATVSGISGNSISLVTNIPTIIQVSGPTLTQGGDWDFDNSQIFIGDVIPQDYQDWPMIVVDTASANETRYLGPEDQGWSKNEFGIVTQDAIFSSLVVTVNINLYTIDDTIARDEIIDLIYNNISEIRDDMATHGIEMIDRTFPTETRTYQDGRWYVTNHFVLRVYCEWTDDLDIINITGVDVSLPVPIGPIPEVTSPLFASWVPGLVFIVDDIPSSGHLTVNSTSNMVGGNTITQGIHTTTITTVVDSNHLIVGSTTGWVNGEAVDTSINIPFNYLITAINEPTSYSSSTLPSGLSLDSSNGLISGIPSVSGIFNITISATNSNGTGTGILTLTIS